MNPPPQRTSPAAHSGDGSDAEGRNLEVLIRIGPDGQVYLHDITADLIPVILTLNPHDPALRRRADAVARFQATEHP